MDTINARRPSVACPNCGRVGKLPQGMRELPKSVRCKSCGTKFNPAAVHPEMDDDIVNTISQANAAVGQGPVAPGVYPDPVRRDPFQIGPVAPSRRAPAATYASGAATTVAPSGPPAGVVIDASTPSGKQGMPTKSKPSRRTTYSISGVAAVLVVLTILSSGAFVLSRNSSGIGQNVAVSPEKEKLARELAELNKLQEQDQAWVDKLNEAIKKDEEWLERTKDHALRAESPKPMEEWQSRSMGKFKLGMEAVGVLARMKDRVDEIVQKDAELHGYTAELKAQEAQEKAVDDAIEKIRQR